MSLETLTHNSLVEKAYNERKAKARMYAKNFKLGLSVVQNMLPDMPVSRHDKPVRRHNADKTYYEDKYPDCTILESEEYEWDVAYRACRDGLMGGIYYSDDDIADINGLAVELVQNNLIEISEKRKQKTGLIYIDALIPAELSKEVSMWYALGVEERLSGTLIERGIQNRHDAIVDEEDPLASSGLVEMEPFADRIVFDIMSAIDALTKNFGYLPSDADMLLSDAAEKARARIESLPVGNQNYLKGYIQSILIPEDVEKEYFYEDDE